MENTDIQRNAGNYKSFAVKLSLWAQGRGLPGASPAWLTKMAQRIARSKNPKMVEHFIKEYRIDYAQANRCSSLDTPGQCAVKYGSLSNFFTRGIKNIQIDSSPVVSPATCKAMLFDYFKDSKVWVKGKRWSASRLLGQPATFADYAVGIFRLRPADYHRFHSPLQGIITNIRHLPGGYLSVDPVVIGKQNVYTENNRVVVQIQSPLFGVCYFVAVGAAGVGTVKILKKVGDTVQPGELLGGFDFGGSTVIVLIPAGRVSFRKSIVNNSKQRIETFVNVGQNVL